MRERRGTVRERRKEGNCERERRKERNIERERERGRMSRSKEREECGTARE